MKNLSLTITFDFRSTPFITFGDSHPTPFIAQVNLITLIRFYPLNLVWLTQRRR
jgi:hypothetical protein